MKQLINAFENEQCEFLVRKLIYLLNRESYALEVIKSPNLFAELGENKYTLLLETCGKFRSVQKFVMENKKIFNRSEMQRAAANDTHLIRQFVDLFPEAMMRQQSTLFLKRRGPEHISPEVYAYLMLKPPSDDNQEQDKGKCLVM